MKIQLTVSDASCAQGFVTGAGYKFLLPGQDFNPENDLVESMKCSEAEIYTGPDIYDDLNCDPGCLVTGSEIAITIVVAGTGLPLQGARMDLSFEGEGILTGYSDSLGVIRFNVPHEQYEYKLSKKGFDTKEGTLVVAGCVNESISMSVPNYVLNPFNIHGFLTVTPPPGESVGRYPLAQFFGVPLNPVIPPGNAYRTRWRLHTDACGYSITYYTGDLDDDGMLLTTGPFGGGTDGTYSGFNPATMEFVSTIYYPEGMYLQLGVLIDNVWTWLPASPCIGSGHGTPI